jgi:mRNA interferase MazF
VDINPGDLLLCEFYFSDFKQTKKRPVLVFKDNLPFNDFVGIPVSSQLQQLHDDEFLIEQSDFIQGYLPKKSKIMIRKTFLISKQVVIKKYGSLSPQRFEQCHQAFCRYFGCY